VAVIQELLAQRLCVAMHDHAKPWARRPVHGDQKSFNTSLPSRVAMPRQVC
jgi:hypothetical protein